MQSDVQTAHDAVVMRLERRLQRERKARAEAEAIAEQGLRALYKKQQEIELLQTVASAANEAVSLAQALKASLQPICSYAGCVVGNVYQPDPRDARVLVPTQLWHAEAPLRYKGFLEATGRTRLTTGSGIGGEVLEKRCAIWMSDVSECANFVRKESARQHGLRAGFAFSVWADGDCVAVLEFFAADIREQDDALLAVMGHIATQLGRVVERERAAERIQHLAYHDTLTSLPNRRLFHDRLEISLVQAREYEREMGVLYLDLDRFKVINDSMGHHCGDMLLQQVAERLGACVRPGDTVARSGGDEFVILLPEVGGVGDITQIAERIVLAMQPPFRLVDQDVYVTFSVGACAYPMAGNDPEALLKNADMALYKAKHEGRNRYALFAPEMASDAQRALVLETSLRRALVNEEFVVHYQPQIDVGSGRIVGLEALVRWEHPELGTIPPAQFIPLAEETGLIIPLGEWVLREACTQVRYWNKNRSEPLLLSVNLSLRQFQQPDLAARIAQVLKETGLEPGSLDLEITESVAVDSLVATQVTMQALKRLGVRLSLDDFGTGYSSLSSLSTLPMDTVKIDRSFVQTVLTDPRNAAIAESIIYMARSLNMQVVAEGVEIPEQHQYLVKHDCDRMQGFLFSKALAPVELAALLADEKNAQKKAA